MLKDSGQSISSEKLPALVHRAKSLFLIIGQVEWALYVTNLNVNDPDTVYESIQNIMEHVQQGFSDIIIMC